tara:strand:+ start:175 stop:426 length:252 start_codon:yes stop_codon:yes gene_type:complete
MFDLSTPEIIVSITIPVLVIIIIIYLYKDKIIRFGKKSKNNIDHLPLGEDSEQEKKRKKQAEKDKVKKNKTFQSRRPKLISSS